MGYVIAAILVLLLIAGFVTFLVTNATRKSGPAASGADDAPGIGGDSSPLGDTVEHAGEHRDGWTQDDPDAGDPPDPDQAAHRARPGEAEGGERLEFEGSRPASERLANRDES
jgi:hypothetical protein